MGMQPTIFSQDGVYNGMPSIHGNSNGGNDDEASHLGDDLENNHQCILVFPGNGFFPAVVDTTQVSRNCKKDGLRENLQQTLTTGVQKKPWLCGFGVSL